MGLMTGFLSIAIRRLATKADKPKGSINSEQRFLATAAREEQRTSDDLL
jgi:hypothetical protein